MALPDVEWLRWHKLSKFVVVGLLLLLAPSLKTATVQIHFQNGELLHRSQAAETICAPDAEDPTLVFYSYHEGNEEYPKNLAFFIKVCIPCWLSCYKALTHVTA